VRVLNGVSLEEQARFAMPTETGSPAEFLKMLDRLCQMYAGLPVVQLQYVCSVQNNGRRQYDRKPVDVAMVTDVRAKLQQRAVDASNDQQCALVLCTIPQPPVQEMEVCTVRLRNIQPCTILYDSRKTLVLKTTQLQEGHMYTVTLTNQWDAGKACFVAGTLLPDRGGVEFSLPPQFHEAGPAAAGLYDVHLVIDHRFRAENRRALTIAQHDDAESVVSSELSSAQSFVPAARFRPGSSPPTHADAMKRTGSAPQLA
jgi:hypothetical protein